MTAPQKSTAVRLFSEADIPQVAELHRTVFALADTGSAELLEAYRIYFRDVFMNNPWRDPAVGPLVHQDATGRINGFMGISSRRLQFNGKPVHLAVMSQFIVDEASRGLPGMKLLSALFAGPQDLTIADEASATVRGMWEGFGGHTSVAQSMRWFYAVRPCKFGLMVLKKVNGIPPLAARMMAPVAKALDAVSARVKFPYKPVKPELEGEEMSAEALLSCISEVGGKNWLRPDYDAETLDWTLQRAASLRRSGEFRRVLVRTAEGKIAGWYMYYLNRVGVSQVLQLQAGAPFANKVVDHLLYHAWHDGATVLSGRLELARQLTQTFSDKHFIFHCGPEWMLFHSRRPELVDAFHRGQTYLSRLEGEWCTHFR